MKGKNYSCNNLGQRKKSDFYQTPYSITEQLLEVEKFNYFIDYDVLEPACGMGAISKVLENYFNNGVWSDKEDGGFLNFNNNYKFNYIITNPPYSLATEFVLKAKELYKNKIAFLMPLSYLHGQRRYKLKIFNELSIIYVFTRYPLLTDSVRSDGKYNTGMMVYAWYVWKKNYQNEPIIRWIDNNKYVLKKNEV